MLEFQQSILAEICKSGTNLFTEKVFAADLSIGLREARVTTQGASLHDDEVPTVTNWYDA